MENYRNSTHMIPVPIDQYNALVRSDERLRIILDYVGSKGGYIDAEPIFTICGVENIDKEEEHE